jgi:hypothetical protein
VAKRPSKSPQLPAQQPGLVPAQRPPSALTPVDARQVMMEAAGLSQERQSSLLRQAVQAAEDALQAEHEVFGPTGVLLKSRPDTFARMLGAKFIRDLVGAAPSKTSVAAAPGQVVVNIGLPDWADPQAVKVGGKVIEPT